MALKHKIDDAAFKKLDKLLQTEYTKDKDGDGYTLDVDGIEDTGALKRAKEHELEKRKDAEKRAKDIQAQLDTLSEELTTLRDEKTRGGDAVAAAEKRLADKHAKREKELQDQSTALQRALQDQMVSGVAQGLASELAGDNAELLLPHLQKRLVAEYKDGKVTTRVLGPDGEVSAVTLDELKKEVLSSGKFAAVVVASKGSGAGGSGLRKGAGGTSSGKKLSEMTATEEAVFAREHPKEYGEMVAAEPVRLQPTGR